MPGFSFYANVSGTAIAHQEVAATHPRINTIKYFLLLEDVPGSRWEVSYPVYQMVHDAIHTHSYRITAFVSETDDLYVNVRVGR